MSRVKPGHHTLPATFLAAFSHHVASPRRDSVIAVGNKRTKRIFTASAGSVGRVHGLYTLQSPRYDAELIERMWHGYERELPGAIEELVCGSLTAQRWAAVLVPFAAAILVRGVDFNERFERRLGSLATLTDGDNTNFARLFEWQRLLGPVLAAQWTLISTHGHIPIITNDVGFVPFRDPRGDIGMAIPLGSQHVLGLIPQRSRTVAVARSGAWWPIIEHGALHPENQHHLNLTVAYGARALVYGATETAVRPYLERAGSHSALVPEPVQLGFLAGPSAAVHELTWHRLVTMLATPPEAWEAKTATPYQSMVTATAMQSGVELQVSPSQFPASLKRLGGRIDVCLYTAQTAVGGAWTVQLPTGW